MKKTVITLLLTKICILITIVSYSQNWTEPVLVESPIGSEYSSTGQLSSMKIINGNPAIAYQDLDHKNLNYIRATDVDGTSWGNPSIVTLVGEVGHACKMEVVNNRPAVAYVRAYPTYLEYVRANDSDGNSWQTPIQVTSINPYKGSETLLMGIVNGKPIIIYVDDLNIKCVISNDIDGNSWANPITIATFSESIRLTSFKIVDGKPAILFESGYYGYAKIEYMSASNIDGSAWNTPIIIENAFEVSAGNIEIVDGRPAISYYTSNGNVFFNNIKFKRADNSNGTTWSSPPISIASGNLVGVASKIKIINGNPSIFYGFDSKTYLANSNNSTGSSWGTGALIPQTSGGSYEIEIVNGNPALSGYYGAINFGYLRSSNVSGTSWGSIVPLKGTKASGYENSLSIVNGLPSSVFLSTLGLKFTQANNQSGTSWAIPTVIGNYGDIRKPFLKEINGKPAVAFTNGNLNYIRANNNNGTSWGTLLSLETNVFDKVSLNTTNGNPSLAFRVFNNSTSRYDLKYKRANDIDGNTWGTTVLVNSNIYSNFIVHEEVNGNPAIVFTDDEDNKLKLVRATNSVGSSWDSPIIVGNDDELFARVLKLLIINGNPAIIFISWDGIRFIKANNPNGTSWGTSQLLFKGQEVSEADVTLINNKPVICFLYANTIKSLVANDLNGNTWALCSKEPSILNNYGIYGGPNSQPGFSIANISTDEVGVLFYSNLEQFPFFTRASIGTIVPPITPTGLDITQCAQSPLQTLTASATVPSGAFIEWYNAATGGNVVINPTQSSIGSITYYAQSKNPTTGCYSISRIPIKLTIVQSLIPDFSLSTVETDICEGQTAIITASQAIITPSVNGVTYSHEWKINGNIIFDQNTSTLTNTFNSVNEFVIECTAIPNSNNLCVINSTTKFIRIYTKDCSVEKKLDAKIFLEGAFDPTTGLMNDQLRISNKIPIDFPYSSFIFTGLNPTAYYGDETIGEGVLDINGNNAIVDWVIVELRSPDNISYSVAQRAALLQRDGDIVEMDGISTISFNTPLEADKYYVVVRHRNHLSIRSKMPVSFVFSPITKIDFTDPNNTNVLLSGAVGNYWKSVNVTTPNFNGEKKVINVGDANRNGIITGADRLKFSQQNGNLSLDYGSATADFNMNGTVTGADALRVDRNITTIQPNIDQ
jgi:Ig-like domain CHU_C associated